MFLSISIIALGWWHTRTTINSYSFYISKLLTMLLIIMLAFNYQSDERSSAHTWILLGLILSFVADLLLMLRKEYLVAGLATFFIAHLFYIIGFAHDPLILKLVDGLLLLLFSNIIFGLVWTRLGKLRLPVLCYSLVVIAMAWLTMAAWHASLTAGSAAAMVGALLLIFCDSIWLLHHFHRPILYARDLVTNSYFAAQFLIAASLAT